MVLDLKVAPPLLLAPVTHDVRRIADPDQMGAVVAVQKAVWQEEERSGTADYLSQTMREDPQILAVYAAYADGQIVSSAWLTYYRPSPFAGLWGGSTLPAYRKQGFYTAHCAALWLSVHHDCLRLQLAPCRLRRALRLARRVELAFPDASAIMH